MYLYYMVERFERKRFVQPADLVNRPQRLKRLLPRFVAQNFDQSGQRGLILPIPQQAQRGLTKPAVLVRNEHGYQFAGRFLTEVESRRRLRAAHLDAMNPPSVPRDLTALMRRTKCAALIVPLRPPLRTKRLSAARTLRGVRGVQSPFV